MLPCKDKDSSDAKFGYIGLALFQFIQMRLLALSGTTPTAREAPVSRPPLPVLHVPVLSTYVHVPVVLPVRTKYYVVVATTTK